MNNLLKYMISIITLVCIIQANALGNEESLETMPNQMESRYEKISIDLNEKTLKTILDQMESRYEEISIELGSSYWNLFTNPEKADLKTPKQKFESFFKNDTLNSLINKWSIRPDCIEDKTLARRVEIWRRILLMAKIEYADEIMQLRTDLEQKLKVSNENQFDRKELNRLMIKLVKLRNQKSVELGYENYIELTFAVNGLGYDWFMEFTDKMYSLTVNDYAKLVEDTKLTKGIKHFTHSEFDKLFQTFYKNNNPSAVRTDNISIIRESLKNIGCDLNELPALLIEKQMPAGIGGQGLMINIPDDFKAVIRSGMGAHIWMHEMGHGLQGLLCEINHPILEGYEWVPGSMATSFAEGMAETTAYFTRNIEWQLKYTDLNKDAILKKKQIADKNATAFIRYWLFRCMKEVAFYMNPDKSYKLIEEEMMRKYLLVNSGYTYEPLANMRFVSYPLYLHNYLMADMIASQIHTSLKNKFGLDYCFNKNVMNHIIENFYSSGELLEWQEKLVKGTGMKLQIESYLDHYNINY